MDMVARVQILDEAVCISYSTNTLGKSMNLTSLSSDILIDNCELFVLRILI